MSVMGMINNPINQQEENFNFHIATEMVYSKFWLKFAKNHKMIWLPLFIDGNIVESQYFDELKKELYCFENFLNTNKDDYFSFEKEFILARIKIFIDNINIAEKFRPNIELYIG